MREKRGLWYWPRVGAMLLSPLRGRTASYAWDSTPLLLGLADASTPRWGRGDAIGIVGSPSSASQDVRSDEVCRGPR